MSKEESHNDSGLVFLGSVKYKQKWSGGECQYDSVEIESNVAYYGPMKFSQDPAKVSELLQRHHKLAKDNAQRSAIPVLEGMGRLQPNILHKFAGLENADANAVHRGTTGIPRSAVDRLSAEMDALAAQIRAKAEVTVTTGADDDSTEDDDAPVS